MRQIGTLTSRDDAQRFAAYLQTQHIPATAEPEGEAWGIWVRNEDQLEAAREALDRFRISPQDERYRDVASKAEQLRRAEELRREQARKNVVEMRGKWRTGPGGSGESVFKQAPLVCVLIGLSLFVGFLTNFGSRVTPARQYLGFSDIRVDPRTGGAFVPVDGLEQIKEGQLWRLVTPIFLHFGLMHLAFNMYLLFAFGRRIEQRYGAWRLGLMVLLIAITSNAAQYGFEGNPNFGGMSGVVYGLLGFLWMKMLYDPQSGLWVDRFTILLAMAWLFGNMLADVPPFDRVFTTRVANTAHFVGLAAGMLLGLAQLAWRRGSRA